MMGCGRLTAPVVPVLIFTLLGTANETSPPRGKMLKSGPYPCPKCNRVFRLPSGLKRHEISHKNRTARWAKYCFVRVELSGISRRFLCEYCPKKFKMVHHLQAHNLTHGEKPLKCSFCYRRFFQIGNLRQHELMHLGKRPFPCPDCPKDFHGKQALQFHRLSSHAGARFQCPLCQSSYSQKGSRSEHIFKCHNLSYYTTSNCRECNITISSSKALFVDHLLKHHNIHRSQGPLGHPFYKLHGVRTLEYDRGPASKISPSVAFASGLQPWR
ncbi:hypothetical protein AAMO2058_000065300 [Amorphochlora amoebiformis]